MRYDTISSLEADNKDSVGHIKFKEGGDYLKEANTCDG